MKVSSASSTDLDGFVGLAASVEHWFGPMIEQPEFHALLARNIQRGTAYVVRGRDGGLLGGLLTGGAPPNYRLTWLVVAADARGQGVGKALVNHAVERFQRPCRVDVVTFGADHPASVTDSARVFYERLGFTPGAAAPLGPEGGTRQHYSRNLL
jgi:GNAT superfamily N-acetyltransferase